MHEYSFLIVQTKHIFKNVKVESDSQEQARQMLTDSLEATDLSTDPDARIEMNTRVKAMDEQSQYAVAAIQDDQSKYYVVWNGRIPGIYDNWEDCKTQTKGFKKALFKSFVGREKAEQAFLDGPQITPAPPAQPENSQTPDISDSEFCADNEGEAPF